MTRLPDLVDTGKQLRDLGIRGVKLFSPGRNRTSDAREALDKNSSMLEAIRVLKSEVPELCVMTETCLCSYTEDGLCVLSRKDGVVDVERSCDMIAHSAVLQAEAGADIVGPAAMLPGSTKLTRHALNEGGHFDVGVMPHVIVRSALYTLYRNAMGIRTDNPAKGALQIHPHYASEALDLSLRFLQEGADMLLLEPALFILDVIALVRSHVRAPIAAFSVSGEYNLLSSCESVNATYASKIKLEFATAVRRAGANMLITYAAPQVVEALRATDGNSAA